MNDLQTLVDSLTEGLELPPQVKNVLVGAIVVASFKAKLDVLFELQSSDPTFVKELSMFIDTAVSKLDAQQTALHQELITKESNKKAGEILANAIKAYGLKDEQLQQVLSRLDSLSGV